MKTLKVTLVVDQPLASPVESLEIYTTIPASYATLLASSTKASFALEKDLKEFLKSKWVTLRPVARRLTRRGKLI